MGSRPRGMVFVLTLLTAMSAAIFSYAGKTAAKEHKLSEDELTLCRFMLEMETTAVSPKLLNAAEKIAKRGKDDKLQGRALGLVALYEAETKKEISKNLAKIAPLILPKDLADNYQKSIEKFCKQLPVFPVAAKWQLTQPELCVTAARILALDKKYVEALDGFNKVGEKVDNLPRVMASDGMGDMLFSLKRYEQCVASYEFALSVISWLKKQSEFQNDPDKTLLTLEKIIRKKLARAMDAWDAERYGPGFVAYRNARRVEFSKDYLAASELYLEIKKDFPETVYAEAASLYRCQCLLKISEDGRGVKNKDEIAKLASNIAITRQLLKKHGKKMIDRVRRMYELEVEKDEAFLGKLKKIPFGSDAEKTALANLNSFINSNPTGLYRGEAHLTAAEFQMENKLDPDAADKHLYAAGTWLSQVKKFDKALSEFRIPYQAAGVTAPPSDVFSEDKFGNINPAEIKPEMVLNRISCPWFINILKTKYCRMRGFIAFTQGDMEKALNFYSLMKKFDRLNQIHESRGDWGDYKRLVWGAENGFFYARPEEIKKFKEKNRFRVLLADYYYITMQFEKMAHIHSRILNNEFGNPNKALLAYSNYMLGTFLYWQENRVEAFERWKITVALDKGGYTGERALFAAGQMATGFMGKKLDKERSESYRREGREMLEELAAKGRNRDFVNQAKLALAMDCYKSGKKEKAVRIIRSIKPENQDEKKIVNTYLQIVKK